ncbi:MAG: Ku protein [Thermoplasmata archaeon]|jgi:DNA end-binding protein Ku|nr:Ku protein [Thermoplasmata archaeon]
MRATWSGSISIGLVNIPVKIYSATKSKKVQFKMLCKEHHLPVHYKMVCENGEELSKDDVVMGIEFEKNSYFIIDAEEIKKLRPKRTDSLEIYEFVDIEQIKPIYYEKSYYVAPQNKKDKAYFLLKELMEEMRKAAIGKVVIKNKEYLVAIQPFEKGLLLSILHYHDEINSMDELENLDEKPEINEKEKELGRMLIQKYYNKEFKLEKYKDTFMEELRELIKKKIEGKEVVVPEEKPKEEHSLIEALKATIEK